MATYTFSQLQQYAQNAGFDTNNAAILAAIGLAESGGNSSAHNPGTKQVPENSYGVFQLNLLAHPDVSVAQASDPQQAANYAYKLWKQAGSSFADWTTYTSGAYRAFLPPGGISGVTNITSGVGSLVGNPVADFFDSVPVLRNFLTAPADLGTRIVGTGVGLAIILIGIISLAAGTARKAVNSPAGTAVIQGAATGAGIAVGQDAAAPQAVVKEETPPPSPPTPPARRYRPFATRGSTRANSTPQQDETVEGTAREVDAPQLRPGPRERVKRAYKGLYPDTPAHGEVR